MHPETLTLYVKDEIQKACNMTYTTNPRNGEDIQNKHENIDYQ